MLGLGGVLLVAVVVLERKRAIAVVLLDSRRIRFAAAAKLRLDPVARCEAAAAARRCAAAAHSLDVLGLGGVLLVAVVVLEGVRAVGVVLLDRRRIRFAAAAELRLDPVAGCEAAAAARRCAAADHLDVLGLGSVLLVAVVVLERKRAVAVVLLDRRRIRLAPAAELRLDLVTHVRR